MRIINRAALLAGCMLTVGSALAQDTFSQGDMAISLGIGTGVVNNQPDSKNPKNRGTFNQKLSFEWCLKSGLINDKASIGLGVALNNSYGGSHKWTGTGIYDYDYNYTVITHSKNHNRWVQSTDTQQMHRSGIGTADYTLWREDISLLLTASFHYEFIDNLDTYVTVGVGPGIVTRHKSGFHNEQGFSKRNDRSGSFDKNSNRTQKEFIISYNDLDHVKWDDGLKDVTACAAMTSMIGARYYFNSNWAVNLELGLVNGIFGGSRTSEIEVLGNKTNMSMNYGDNYGVLNIGVTYKF